MIQLYTERLIIRDPEWRDLPPWHRLKSDPKTMYYIEDLMTRSEEESRKDLSDAIAESSAPDRKKYFLVMEQRNKDQRFPGEFTGTIGYTVTSDTPLGKIARAGYHILPEYHNKGFTTEAFKELLRFAFEDNSVYRIEAGCFAENRASERVMQKCGMIRESYKKECAWHDGRMKDRVSYRLLKSEWQAGPSYIGSFWPALDKLVAESEIVIDQPKGSSHPRYPGIEYPLDYGYLKNTASMDGGGIDVWKGANGSAIDAIICTVDLLKKDSEIKILIGCDEAEKELALASHNNSEYMKGILIRR